jgi:hypothetical protein
MSFADGHFMDEEDHYLQQKLVGFLQSRERYRTNGAKNLAADIECDPRTAKNILAGHFPRPAHLRRIVRMFRRDVIEALFAEDIDAVNARLAQEERELEERLHAIRTLRGQDARPYACAPTAREEART